MSHCGSEACVTYISYEPASLCEQHWFCKGQVKNQEMSCQLSASGSLLHPLASTLMRPPELWSSFTLGGSWCGRTVSQKRLTKTCYRMSTSSGPTTPNPWASNIEVWRNTVSLPIHCLPMSWKFTWLVSPERDRKPDIPTGHDPPVLRPSQAQGLVEGILASDKPKPVSKGVSSVGSKPKHMACIDLIAAFY